MAIDWKRVRAEFPALQRWTFLNTATYGQLARRTTQAIAAHFAHRDELACADFLEWFDDADRLRQSLARLISCTPDDIAFVQNAASALGMLIGGIEWKPGDRVVTLKDEFPNNLYFPALLGERGVEYVEVEWEAFWDAITPRTRLVLMSTVNYANGFRPPVQKISDYLRERGVLFYLDGTQSVGALQFSAEKVRPSMFPVNAYKWMLSPNGAAFAYIAPEVRQWLEPAVVGWRSDRRWREVDALHHGAPEFKTSAERYEGGMLSFPALYGMAASVDMMLELRPGAIEARVEELAGQCRSILRRHGGEIAHEGSGIVAAGFDADPSAMTRALREERIQVSARHGRLRVSTQFYNDEEDLSRLDDALARILPRVRG